MEASKRECQNCKNGFVIGPEDFDFYKKIDVPPPTWCPECRAIRRFMFRNERTWYRRKCDATDAPILSIIAPEKPLTVYEFPYWKSDAWDALSYGRDYDFSKPFFQQFGELLKAVPHPNLVQKNNVGSDYSNYTLNLKKCYFVASVDTGEDCAYVFTFSLNIRNCVDVHISQNIEWSYEVVDCTKSSNLRFCQLCEGCVDSWLLYDCRNCTSCVGCVGLRSKSYCIFNEQYSKEEYATKLEKLNLGSYGGLSAARKKLEELKLRMPRKYAAIIQSEQAVGDDIEYSRNVSGFVILNNCENVRYGYRISNNSKDIWDSFVSWNGSELHYEALTCTGQRMFFSALIWGGHDVSYSYNCFDCENIFGCVGLRNKSYCIFNKQYAKEEYEQLIRKIRSHMDAMPYIDGRGITYLFGEFFPPDIAPFAYNETIAQDYYPSTREEAAKRGYTWRDPDTRDYKITVQAAALPDNIADAPDSILNETIACEHADTDCGEQCATAFKMVPMEMQFYRKMGVPLPRRCPSCRHYGRVKLKNPMKLWHRRCMCDYQIHGNTVKHAHHQTGQCPNEFQTSYSPDRPEIVYCEQCYQNEVA